MGKFVKGDVVVVPFPFSDLSAAKRRPADSNIVLYRAGVLSPKKVQEVIARIIQIISA